MFAVNAEITLNASERDPPAEQYVLNPSGRAVCLTARKNFLPPSTWQGSDIHTHVWGVGCAIEQTTPPFHCDKNLPPSKVWKKKGGKKEGKEPQPVNCIHHYHNWLRSWLVDDWFMSNSCKPRKEREDGNILIYLFVSTAGVSPECWRPQIRLTHRRLLSACHKSSHGDTDFFLNWSTWSLCTTCSFPITDKN